MHGMVAVTLHSCPSASILCSTVRYSLLCWRHCCEDEQFCGSQLCAINGFRVVNSASYPSQHVLQSTIKSSTGLEEAEVEPSRSSRRVAECMVARNAGRSRSSSNSSIQAASPSISDSMATGGLIGCFPCRRKAAVSCSKRYMRTGILLSTGDEARRRYWFPFQGTDALLRCIRARGAPTAGVRRQGGHPAGATMRLRRGPFSGWLQRRLVRGGGVNSRGRARPQSVWKRSFRKVLSTRLGRQRTGAMHGPAARLRSDPQCYHAGS